MGRFFSVAIGVLLLLLLSAPAQSTVIAKEDYEDGTAPGWSGTFDVKGRWLRVLGPECNFPDLGCSAPDPTTKTFLLPPGLKEVVVSFYVGRAGERDEGSLTTEIVDVYSETFYMRDPEAVFSHTFTTSAPELSLRLRSTAKWGAVVLDDFMGIDSLLITAERVPEPGSLALLGLGLAGLGLSRRRKAA